MRGEYLACAPAMRFIEDTVVRIPERVIQIATAQLRLNDAGAAFATLALKWSKPAANGTIASSMAIKTGP